MTTVSGASHVKEAVCVLRNRRDLEERVIREEDGIGRERRNIFTQDQLSFGNFNSVK